MLHLNLPQAILLIGLTGAGKSPLGDYLSERGIAGRRCLHFDFGSELRTIGDAGNVPIGLTERDVLAIKDFLAQSRLLTDETFYIAEAVWHSFMAEHSVKADDIIVLNGLPRKTQQARSIRNLLKIRSVIYLSCSLEIAIERIQKNSGGDRAGRIDDAIQKIRRKYITFNEDTLPLVAFYRRELGADSVHEASIGVSTVPLDILDPIIHAVTTDLNS